MICAPRVGIDTARAACDICRQSKCRQPTRGYSEPWRIFLDLLQGTLDLLVLKTLSWGGTATIARWTQQSTAMCSSSARVRCTRLSTDSRSAAGSRASGGSRNTNRRTKVYRLTTIGCAQLKAETVAWSQFVEAMGKILRTTSQPA